jgi:hypothetical protein
LRAISAVSNINPKFEALNIIKILKLCVFTPFLRLFPGTVGSPKHHQVPPWSAGAAPWGRCWISSSSNCKGPKRPATAGDLPRWELFLPVDFSGVRSNLVKWREPSHQLVICGFERSPMEARDRHMKIVGGSGREHLLKLVLYIAICVKSATKPPQVNHGKVTEWILV